MPQMGVFKAEARRTGANVFEATLDIVHGGDWRVTVAVDGEETVFDFDVK
jgi:hypothetical protein